MQLVTRSTRRLNLVDEVERYAAGTARLLPEITDLEDEAGRLRHGVRGRVAVRSTIGLGRAHIAPVLGQFQRRHPGVEIDLELSHLPPHIAGTPFDFAIRVGRRGIPACAPGASPGPGAAAVHSGRVHRPPRKRLGLRDLALRHGRRRGRGQGPRRDDQQRRRDRDALVSGRARAVDAVAVEGRANAAVRRIDPSLADIPAPDAPIYAVYPSAHSVPRRARMAVGCLAGKLAGRLGGGTANF
ncbi:LysR family transcriptional regulator [Amycolatopsis rubida]|uniref:LysR family transcriptional regulator n=1 Tax=Amycolatopsis rubida TaxID=112413 RepID=A0ABX0BPD1_9PSEU|nr:MULTISPECIES: hypothetical protein [Amycolatopsis]MYW89740.1 LysR family transcriptional regulator [Amycolatopsis rubida]NEC54716.1 LysR family transcriptional regulator [Amycolatopsis rubida]